MDNENKVEKPQKHEFFWEAAYKDPVRRKGISNFLTVLIVITSVACLVLSCLIAFPLQADAVDIWLAKGLIIETWMFIVYTLLMGITLSRCKINKKENSSIMVLIVIFYVAFWIMMALSMIFIRTLRH